MMTFFLHGFGSDADEFRSHWNPEQLPPMAFFLDAPEPDPLTSRRRWFPFSSRPGAAARGVANVVERVEQEIRATLASRTTESDVPLAVVGHSQGAMVCFELVRRQRLRVSEAICYAGYLPEGLTVPAESRPRSTLLRVYSSSADTYIDPRLVERTVGYFRGLPGVDVRHYLSSTLPHRFSRDWLTTEPFQCAASTEGGLT